MPPERKRVLSLIHKSAAETHEIEVSNDYAQKNDDLDYVNRREKMVIVPDGPGRLLV